jgi:cystathionine beta-lyase/cystathionine gamma-synthase
MRRIHSVALYIRYSAGVEDVEYPIADLDAALGEAGS